MSHYYLDSSAAVKLYAAETGTIWLRQLLFTDPSAVTLSSQLLRLELWSAFARRQRDGSLSVEDYEKIIIWFTEHRHNLYRLVPINDLVLQEACDLIEKYPLRGADAIHLATAVILNRRLAGADAPLLTFLSADRRLNSAAISAGLTVDDPNDHP